MNQLSKFLIVLITHVEPYKCHKCYGPQEVLKQMVVNSFYNLVRGMCFCSRRTYITYGHDGVCVRFITIRKKNFEKKVSHVGPIWAPGGLATEPILGYPTWTHRELSLGSNWAPHAQNGPSMGPSWANKDRCTLSSWAQAELAAEF